MNDDTTRRAARRTPAWLKAAIAAMIMVVALALIGTLAKDDHPKDSIPACKYEDGSGQADCYWDAQTQGNGKGHDYVKITTR